MESEKKCKKRKLVEGWSVPASKESHDCINDIRIIEEKYFKPVLEKRNRDLELIKLSLGDPTVFGTLPVHEIVKDAVKQVVDEEKSNGYGPSYGLESARTAVAEAFSTAEAPLTSEDVIMASGCSGALDLCISALTNAGDNLIAPSPGFSLYKCLASARNVDLKYYKLMPEKSWEVDLEDLERQIDHKTRAIIVCSPSNPCGCVYSREHLKDILEVAERHFLPVISDEVYFGMVFDGETFHSVAAASENVPVLTVGGTAKKFMVPGWRMGWILIHDRNDALKKEITPGLFRLAMKILGPCGLVQAAIPEFFKVPQSYHQRNMCVVEENAKMCYRGLSKALGLKAVMPRGAMYMMVVIELDHFPDFESSVEFTKQLLISKSVFCLPGEVFQYPGSFRVVLVMTKEKIADACERIVQFCQEHYQP